MKLEHVKAEHVDNRKLLEVVLERAAFDVLEMEHIGDCEECLQLIRILVWQNVKANPA